MEHHALRLLISSRNHQWNCQTSIASIFPQLPHSLQSLIECIGIESAYRLTCAYGGRPKYIPKHLERTKLADVLPPEALQSLIKRFAGVALEIPKPDHFLRQLRNLQIKQESADGLSRSLLADKYGLSLRQIGNIRRQEDHAR